MPPRSKAVLLISRVVLFFNIVVAALFLLTCLIPYLNPVRWWFISLLGLGFGVLLLLQFFFIVFWLIFKPRYLLVSLITLLVGWKDIGVFLAIHTSPPFKAAKPQNSIRIATWNVARFIEWRRNNNSGSQMRLKMMQQLKEQQADVVCMQEFFTSTDSIYYNNIRYIKEKLGYP